MELEDYRDQIVEWLKLGKYGKRYNKVEDFTYIDEKENDLHVLLYTDHNSYKILVSPYDNGTAYLGCVMSSRKPRAGEDWTRGNDLTDGKFSKDTWDNIVADILSCEFVDIKRPLRCMYEGDERGVEETEEEKT